MPFDPKLIRTDEPPLAADGQLELPDDLAALARQLGDDAEKLVRCYPPIRSSAAISPAPQRNRMVAMAAILFGTALAIVVALSTWLSPSAQRLAGEAESNRPDQPQASLANVSVGTHLTVSLAELSSPEIEALLDLMEREPAQPVSVSF